MGTVTAYVKCVILFYANIGLFYGTALSAFLLIKSTIISL